MEILSRAPPVSLFCSEGQREERRNVVVSNTFPAFVFFRTRPFVVSFFFHPLCSYASSLFPLLWTQRDASTREREKEASRMAQKRNLFRKTAGFCRVRPSTSRRICHLSDGIEVAPRSARSIDRAFTRRENRRWNLSIYLAIFFSPPRETRHEREREAYVLPMSKYLKARCTSASRSAVQPPFTKVTRFSFATQTWINCVAKLQNCGCTLSNTAEGILR